ncbi:MAG: NTP transferase domain-containing protein [Pseudomonadales bacterium]
MADPLSTSAPIVKRSGCCAVIPARGGSKGLPGKNTMPLAGKPLIAHCIIAAQQAASVDRVFVSTDSATIADVAQRYGAEVIERPSELGSDVASSESALLHALEMMHVQDYHPEHMLFLQCTSPFTRAEDVDGTLAALVEQNAQSAVAVAPYHHHIWSRDASGFAKAINHDPETRLRRQDTEPQFLEAGAVYALSVAGFLAAGHRFFGHTALYEMPFERVAEIDEPIDMVLAEARFKHLEQQDRLAALPSPVAALVMDFDGVFTDNQVIVREDGLESVRCSRGDGLGIAMLRETGLPMVVISKERNPVTAQRCKKLNLPVLTGIDEKRAVLRQWCREQGIALSQVVYLGNDVNDLECLEDAGCAVVVRDAHPRAMALANIVLAQDGGQGAVRALCELILEQQAESERV